MALQRDVLKKKFRNGSRPTEKDFDTFIDSSIIAGDDGIVIENNGLTLTKKASSTDTGATYNIKFGDTLVNNLEFSYADDPAAASLLSINQQGVTTGKLAVNGPVTMQARQGTFTQQNVDAPVQPKNARAFAQPANPMVGNGAWQTILYTKKISQAYEIVAQLNGATQSMLFAIASTSDSPDTDANTDKQSFLNRIIDGVADIVKRLLSITNTKIKVTQCYSDWLDDRIRIKWVENYNSYSLQLRAKKGYVYYSITQIWGEDFIASK